MNNKTFQEEAIKAKETQNFNNLAKLYQPLFEKLCLKHNWLISLSCGNLSTEDLAQEMQIHMLKKFHKFDKNKTQFKNWLICISNNFLLSYIYKKNHRGFTRSGASVGNHLHIISIFNEIKQNYQIKDTLESTENNKPEINLSKFKLSKKEKEVIVSYYWKKQTLKELSIKLKCSISMVGKHKKNALKIIKNSLKGEHYAM
jgi:RNA polymerase sigma factor (sigma-70 family)